MKLVPLGDRVVLKQCRGRRDHKIRYHSYQAVHRRNRRRQK